MNSFFNQSRSYKLIQNIQWKTSNNELFWSPDTPAPVLLTSTELWIPSCYSSMITNKDRAYLYAVRYKRYDGDLNVFYPVESFQLSIIDTISGMILYQTDYDEQGLMDLFNLVSTRYSGLESYFS